MTRLNAPTASVLVETVNRRIVRLELTIMSKRSEWAKLPLVEVQCFTDKNAAKVRQRNHAHRSSTLFSRIFERTVKAGRAGVTVYVVVTRGAANAETA